MGKAVLVMDMPITCLECPFRYKSETMSLGNFTYQSLFRCNFEPEDLDEDEGDTVFLNDIMMQGKPDWCPLQPMPEYSRTGKSDYYQWGDWEDGWNACINGLLPE